MSSGDPSPLHLPNLSIERFRGIKSLWLPKLGRATLLTGKNGVGKTTVLEAARIWAARGTRNSIASLLLDREEIISRGNKDIDQYDGAFVKTLFWGRDPKKSDQISIGPKNLNDSELLKLTYIRSYSKSNLADYRKINTLTKGFPFPETAEIEIMFGRAKETINWGFGTVDEEVLMDEFVEGLVEDVQSISLDPRLSGTRPIVGFWTKFALTPTEGKAVDALNIVTTENVERIAVVGEGHAQKIIAKMEHVDTPVPLRSLGDGATRLLAVASAISFSRGGFLFIDEAEIGIHYSAQVGFWRMVLQAAHDNNVQVIATTHSFDCVKGFAEAAFENEAVEGVLVRIEEDGEALKAITFDESELEVVARRNIEVR